MESRILFPMLTIFSEALGKPKGHIVKKSAVSYRDAKDGAGGIIPFIRNKDGKTYYPPMPNKDWKNTSYRSMQDGTVCFPNSKAALPYTILNFLQDEYKEGFDKYLSNLLKWNQCKYKPVVVTKGKRVRDPEEMVVLYSHEERNNNNRNPVAMVLKINSRVGVFVPVDKFGKAYKASNYQFSME